MRLLKNRAYTKRLFFAIACLGAALLVANSQWRSVKVSQNTQSSSERQNSGSYDIAARPNTYAIREWTRPDAYAPAGRQVIWNADNPAQQLCAVFTPRGISVTPGNGNLWSFGLECAATGYGTAVKPVSEAAVITAGDRIEYNRGDVLEWFENGVRGIEHGFVLSKPPADNRDAGLLRVDLTLRGGMTPRLTLDGQCVNLHSADGQRALRYTDLYVSDAAGRSLSSRMELKAERLSLLIDDRNAVFPLTIDPLIQNASPVRVASRAGQTVAGLSPKGAIKNGAGFELTVTGAGYASTDTVFFETTALTTVFDSATQLRATVPANLLTQLGKFNITVKDVANNPSNTFSFVVYNSAVGKWVVDKRSTSDTTGEVTLGFALQNVLFGDLITFDSVKFDPAQLEVSNKIQVFDADAQYTLNTNNITIDGQNHKVLIEGTSNKDGLVITSANNTILGLTFRKFQNGIKLQGAGATGNILGGDRALGSSSTASEKGNGQGLRLSQNTNAGIVLTTGASGNTIKGCWVGVDRAGTAAEANTYGIYVDTGSANNVIGSTVASEANIVSGNSDAGIVVTDSSSDNNRIIGSLIGAGVGAVSRLARGYNPVASRDTIPTRVNNRFNGVVFSNVTQANQVGGTNTGEGNVISYNGTTDAQGNPVGSGVFVDAAQQNRVRQNSIFENVNSGIDLKNGGNNNISPPVIEQITPVGNGLNGRVTVQVRGTVAGVADGSVVELFNDIKDQGETPLTTTTVTGGKFTVNADLIAGRNVTSTVTDTSNNTSRFALFGGSVPNPPTITVGPTVSENPAVPGRLLSFNASATDPNGDPVTLSWDFGDGTTATGEAPTHAYAAAGNFQVVVTASDGTLSTQKSLSVIVVEPGTSLDKKPLFTVPPIIGFNSATTFVLTNEADYGTPLTASWDFGDGTTGAGTPVTKTYSASGIFTLSLFASGPNGAGFTTQPAVVARDLVVSKAMLRLNFTTNKDGCTLQGTLILPEGFTFEGKEVTVDVGGAAVSFPALLKGRAKQGTSNVSLKTPPKGGPTNVKASLKGNFNAKWTDEGLVNVDVPEKPVSMPVVVIVGTEVFGSSKGLIYSAKRARGKAK